MLEKTLESQQTIEKIPSQQWIDILEMRKNCTFYGTVEAGKVLDQMDDFIHKNAEYYKQTLLGDDVIVFESRLDAQKIQKNYESDFQNFKRTASGTMDRPSGSEMRTDANLEKFFLHTGFVYQNDLSMQIMRFLGKNLNPSQQIVTINYSTRLNQSPEYIQQMDSVRLDTSRVQRLANNFDIKSREQEQQNEKEPDMPVLPPPVLKLTDTSQITDKEILKVHEAQEYRINDQKKIAEQRQVIENTSIDLQEEKKKLENKNPPQGHKEMTIKENFVPESIDDESSKATMDYDLEKEPTDPTKIGYISINPDFNVGKQYILRDCSLAEKNFAPFTPVIDDKSAKVAVVQQAVSDGSIIWSLYNDSRGYTFPNPNSFKDSNSNPISVNLLYDPNNHIFTIETGYIGVVSFDLYAPYQLSSQIAYIQHPNDISPRGPIASKLFDDAKLLIQKGQYDDAVAIVKEYFASGLYSAFAKDFIADMAQRCEHPVGDCDVINEAFVAMLTSLGFTASLQYCYAENGDGVITDKERHAMTRILIPNGRAILVDATPSMKINKKVDDYVGVPTLSDNPLDKNIYRGMDMKRTQEQVDQYTKFFINEFLEKIYQEPALDDTEALAWMEMIAKKEKPSSMEVVIYSILYIMAYPYGAYDPKMYSLLGKSEILFNDRTIQSFFSDKFGKELVIAPVNWYELPIISPQNITEIGTYVKYYINKGNFPIITGGKIDQTRKDNMYDKYDKSGVRRPIAKIQGYDVQYSKYHVKKNYHDIDEISIEIDKGTHEITVDGHGLDDKDFADLVRKHKDTFHKAEGLVFPNNEITDLSPIKDLKNLVKLDFSDNEIRDLSPIRDLKHLKSLDFSQNRISDLSPLKDLKNLWNLGFSNNQIRDLSPIKDLKNLENLGFSNNQIRDLSPIRDLKNLNNLIFSQNQIRDLSPIRDLKHLQSLDFSQNQISDLSPIRDLKHLKSLDFSQNQISDLLPIKDLKNLQYLDFSDNEISDLLPIKDLKNLQDLHFSQNQIRDLSIIKDFEKLRFVDFSQNQIRDLSPIKDLKNLQYLDFSQNQIRDLSIIKDFEKLQFVDCSNNQISDLSFLKFAHFTCLMNFLNNDIKNIPENVSIGYYEFGNNPMDINISVSSDVRIGYVPGLGETKGITPNISPLDPLFTTQDFSEEQKQDCYFRSMEKILCTKPEDTYLSIKEKLETTRMDLSLKYIENGIINREGLAANKILSYQKISNREKDTSSGEIHLQQIVAQEYSKLSQELADKNVPLDPEKWQLCGINLEDHTMGKEIVAHDDRVPFEGTFALKTGQNTFVSVTFDHPTTLDGSYAQAQVLKALIPKTFTNVLETIPEEKINIKQNLENDALCKTIRSRVWDLKDRNKDIYDKIYTQMTDENKILLFETMIKYHPDFYKIAIKYSVYTPDEILAKQSSNGKQTGKLDPEFLDKRDAYNQTYVGFIGTKLFIKQGYYKIQMDQRSLGIARERHEMNIHYRKENDSRILFVFGGERKAYIHGSNYVTVSVNRNKKRF